MNATFEMRNAWRDDWVPLPLSLVNSSTAPFAGSGNHVFQVTFSAYELGGGGGIAWFESSEANGLYGFGRMLFPGEDNAPPIGGWAFGPFHVKSEDSWSVSWQSGEGDPTPDYDGGYGPA